MTDILTPVGRIVSGHPMVATIVTDDQNKPKMGADGITPRTEVYFGLAIAKGAEQQWAQTEWGQKIYAEAVAGWPAGEHGAPTFAWKIIDGDSAIPNKKGKTPNSRDGWPGHWVLQLSTGIDVKCYHAGRYSPEQQIKNKAELKAGDYVRVQINCKANAPSPSPGVYLNPQLVELTRAGIEIQTGTGPAASDAFAGAAGTLPAGALVDTAVATQAPAMAAAVLTQAQTLAPAMQPAMSPAVQPAADFLNPAAGPAVTQAPVVEEKFLDANNTAWTRAQLVAAGIPGATINAMPRATA